MEVIIEKKCTLSSLVSDVTIFPQNLINVRLENMEEVLASDELKEAQQAILDELKDTGRIVLRKSGTEPVVRVMVEAMTKEEAVKYSESLKDSLIEISEKVKA